MPGFKHFSGNYKAIAELVRESDVLCKPMTKAAYLEQVKLDLDRARYVHLKGDADDLKQSLQNTAHLDCLQDPVYSYRQEDFHGGSMLHQFFARDHHLLANRQHALYHDLNPDTILDPPAQRISLSYLNDKDELCGLCLQLVRDTNEEVNLPDRDYLLSVSVITGVNRVPQERQVLLIQQEALLPPAGSPAAECTNTLSVPEVDETLRKAINSDAIHALLNGILTEDGVDLEAFNALNARLEFSKNIDDRDTKLAFLHEVHQSSEDPELKKVIESMIESATNDLNYFKNKTLAALKEDLNQPGFFRRNIGRIALIGACLGIPALLLTPPGFVSGLLACSTSVKTATSITGAILGGGALLSGISRKMKGEKKSSNTVPDDMTVLEKEDAQNSNDIEDEFDARRMSLASAEEPYELPDSTHRIRLRLKGVEEHISLPSHGLTAVSTSLEVTAKPGEELGRDLAMTSLEEKRLEKSSEKQQPQPEEHGATLTSCFV